MGNIVKNTLKHSQLSLAQLPRIIIVIIEDDIEDNKR